MTATPSTPARLLRVGLALEWTTLAWNVAGVAVLAYLAIASASTALAGFGLDSLIEIGASTVVIWELSGSGDGSASVEGSREARQRRALRAIGVAFVLLAAYLVVQSTVALVLRHHPDGSVGGIIWTAVTAVVMFGLAAAKSRVGRLLGNPVLRTEGRVTMIDGLLAVAVLLGVLLDMALGWWWADPVAGLVIVYYAIREAVGAFRHPA